MQKLANTIKPHLKPGENLRQLRLRLHLRFDLAKVFRRALEERAMAAMVARTSPHMLRDIGIDPAEGGRRPGRIGRPPEPRGERGRLRDRLFAVHRDLERDRRERDREEPHGGERTGHAEGAEQGPERGAASHRLHGRGR